MNFKTYYSSLTTGEKINLSKRLDTSVAYLSQLANGHRKAGAKILLKIESATFGNITPQMLRPDHHVSMSP